MARVDRALARSGAALYEPISGSDQVKIIGGSQLIQGPRPSRSADSNSASLSRVGQADTHRTIQSHPCCHGLAVRVASVIGGALVRWRLSQAALDWLVFRTVTVRGKEMA